jgi:hypothetical protein
VETTALDGRLEHKVMGHRVVHRSESGATYAWIEPDDDPVSAPSTGPSWDDGPALERAKAAGRAALAAGYGAPTSRSDGLVACGHCTPCAYNRPDRCRQPQQKALAREAAGQAQADRIDQAEATALELQGVIWREQARRGLAF